MFYKTIKESVTTELITKKSRFISILIPLVQLQDVEKELHDAKQKYPGANHYCFAYMIRQNGVIGERCSLCSTTIAILTCDNSPSFNFRSGPLY